MRNKIILIIFVILLAGLYFDIKNVGKYCNSQSYQSSVIFQSIIPFRAERETWIIGYGDKISNFPVIDDGWFKYPDGTHDTWSVKTRCIVSYDKNNKPYEGEHFHYIDLRFWQKAN